MVLHFEIERLWKDGNKAKANTRSKEGKPQIPFHIVEKKVSLLQGHKKRQVSSLITVDLFINSTQPKWGQHAIGVSPATSSTDSKKPRLSNDSDKSLEVELGLVRNTVLYPDIWTTDTCFQWLIATTRLDKPTCQVTFTQWWFLVVQGMTKDWDRARALWVKRWEIPTIP